MKRAAAIGGLSGGLLLLLAVPGSSPPVPAAPPGGEPFAWNQDSLWHSLEREFTAVRATGCATVAPEMSRGLTTVAAVLDSVTPRAVTPADPLLETLERSFFALGPSVAVCPARLRDYVTLSGRLRQVLKDQSRRWDPNDIPSRQRLYRLLYGTRAAVEEVLLHHPDSALALLPGRDEPSATPAAVVHGVTIRSGDMLVSRGGYPTSALIARGNDYPGNFSHVGLVHVDSVTHAASVIEAHIEIGVAVATAEEYLADKKLRLMVLRPRADLPQLVADPLLPHRAASLALERARAGHIPYDFAMDYDDPSRLFCSEVASSVYRDLGVTLWMGLSTISRPGLRRWLSSLGVRHFATQEPSDLEYDPQLVVVAEWRDPTALMQDHIDNAVLDVMLDGADAGEDLTYSWYTLPAARLAKAYSWAREQLGGHGPIPEGMSAPSALRHETFVTTQRVLAERVRASVAKAATAQGYPPPYWDLVGLAREATAGARTDYEPPKRSP
ncbi:MAG: YiiX/YebB-like N1pC/P60 family cysteine hydrolase [Gemmatimonadota bacterium]|nr:YiiX/YebB-like N1pC/P60 family cysteine hydrolase [Gemmatimonadota bacterium]MDH5197364.1 YiiX/YebB-like N1pC/P60 family cysteine hydrolase [Gemmatimonadota bacterium]